MHMSDCLNWKLIYLFSFSCAWAAHHHMYCCNVTRQKVLVSQKCLPFVNKQCYSHLNHLFLKHLNVITSNLRNNEKYLKCSVIVATHNYPEFHMKENKQTSIWVNRSICSHSFSCIDHFMLRVTIYMFCPQQLIFHQKSRYF